MHIVFKTYNCGSGDCLFLLLKEGEKQFSIMVDCGKLTDPISDYIKNELLDTINLLIVTHIDNDHISGVATLLTKHSNLRIEKILFNSYHRVMTDHPQQLDEKQLAILEELKHRLPVTEESTNGKTSVKEAIALSECILKNADWANAWERKPVIKGDVIDLKEFGKITILSPLQEDLNLLETQFKKEFWSKFYEKYAEQYDEEETLYELLLRLWERTLIENTTAKVGYAKPTKESFLRAAQAPVHSVSLPNRCSIAFIYEYQEHRFLLLGDADPEIVSGSLYDYYKNQIPLIMDLIKVSHHGSSHSTTLDLIAIADSLHYFFTGGNREERPSLETLAKIITAQLHGQEQRVLHFNRKNKVINDVLAIPEIAEYHCEIDCNNLPYEATL